MLARKLCDYNENVNIKIMLIFSYRVIIIMLPSRKKAILKAKKSVKQKILFTL